jgi:hypothetical protein
MGIIKESLCGRCNNHTARQIVKLTTWLTLFFIPIIPYSRRYLLVCPICGQARELTKPEFKSLTEGGDNYADQPVYGQYQRTSSDDSKYAGKTPTQIAFLKHMEELSAGKEAEHGRN